MNEPKQIDLLLIFLNRSILGYENGYGDLIIKFKPIVPDNLTEEQLKTLEELFPKINDKKKLPNDKEYELEIATESDFEYSDSEDEDSEYYESDEEDESEEESD